MREKDEQAPKRRTRGDFKYPPTAERFWAKVQKGDGCWEWTGSRLRDGYGRIRHNGIQQVAHRISWELHFGSVPDGLQVCHHCDNPPCVRPEHLFLGTISDNALDMIAKNRHFKSRGEQNPNARLTASVVLAIRADHIAGVSQRAIGRRYGISASAVAHVLSGRTWRHVEASHG